jgi:hypothetical protein
MARTIATIGGIALAPGVSKNRRLYTPDHVKNAVARAQQRIESGDRPMVMLTHHGAGDDSTKIAASLTAVSLDEAGRARYTAAVSDTAAGRDIASLVDTSDGSPPHLDGVSIRGAWLGTVRKVRGPDGQPVETADDLEWDGLDFTRSPGVDAASIDTFAWAKQAGRTETTERVLITESVQEAQVTAISEETEPVTETAPEGAREALRVLLGSAAGPVAEAGTPAVSKRGSGLSGAGRVWADPGYQADKKQRYDLSTKAKAKAAWSYISQADNAKAYTAAQLKRVKGRIVKALKKFGVTVAAEGWTIEPAFQVSESVLEWMGEDPSRAGSWSITASNGPVNLNLSSYCMDPADLDVILRAAADAACAALKALDPDMDGDIDLPGVGPDTDPDHDAPESAPDGPVTETAPAPDPASEAGQQEEEEPAMADATTATPAAETAPPALDPAAIAEAAIAKHEAARKERKAAKKAARAAAESAQPGQPAVTETAEQREARLVEERVQAQLASERQSAATAAALETEDQRVARRVEERLVEERQKLVATGQVAVQRKGVEQAVTEHTAPKVGGGEPAVNMHGLPAGWPDKELHKYSPDELAAHAGPVLDQHIFGRSGRAVTDIPA